MKKTFLALALTLGAGNAMAIDFSKPYYGVLGSAMVPDDKRPNDTSYGAQFISGFPINPNVNLEPNLYVYYMPRENDDKADLTYGGGLDLMVHQTLKGFTSFVVLGGGVSYEDVTQVEEIGGYGNVGFGLITQLPFWPKWSLRSEVRGVYEYNDASTEGRSDTTFDVRGGLGLQRGFAGTEPVAPPPPVDTDGDGVVDTTDLCPGTPPGTPVDATGCPAAPGDADGDGVPDTLDQCPDTPAGTAVDPTGCPVKPVGNVDDDGDGVANEIDKCPNTPAGFKVDGVGCLVEQTLALQSVNFEFDSERLTAEAKSILDGIATGLSVQQAVQVLVVGHTDALGPQSYNLSLSQKRAKAVINYLTEKGVAKERLKSEGEGEFTPIASNDTEAGRAQNRRVEFKVLVQ